MCVPVVVREEAFLGGFFVQNITIYNKNKMTVLIPTSFLSMFILIILNVIFVSEKNVWVACFLTNHQ